MMSASFVCPFCPLHCDDLDPAKLVGDDPQRVGQGGVSCWLLDRRLGPALEYNATARGASQAVIQLARGWVAQATSMLITGQVIDLETSRAVCRLAERTGAIVMMDPGAESSAADAAAYRETFARDGMFATTLGDAASPHNAVILIGDSSRCWPRLRQRLAAAGEILSWERTDALAQRLAWLRRLIRRAHEGSPQDDLDVTRSRELCDRATSIIFAVAPGSLDAAQARPFWSTMVGLLGDLNPRRRAALLRFDDHLTLRNVVAWSCDRQAESPVGDPPATADVVIELTNPWPSDRIPGSTAEDSGARINSGSAGRAAALSKRIIIGGQAACGHGDAANPQVCHLPASSPGVGRHAVVLRGDGSVALPLRPLAATELPSPAEVLGQLLT